MKKTSIIFCILSLLISLLIAIIVFPIASMTDEELAKAQTAQSAEEFSIFDLGEFGFVTVIEMLDYYLLNPPDKGGAGNQDKQKRHGC